MRPFPGQVIREVLANLFMNALEAMPDRGGLAVRAVTGEAGSGCGWPTRGRGLRPTLAEHVFTPDASRPGEPGRGIGLAGCRHLLGRRRRPQVSRG